MIIVLVNNFFFSNDFSNITKIEYQRYNHSEGNFGEIIVIEDEDSINQLTKIFNKARHQNVIYEKEYRENIKLTLFYPDETTETIRVWIGFGSDYDLLESETREGTFKLKNKKSREALLEILK